MLSRQPPKLCGDSRVAVRYITVMNEFIEIRGARENNLHDVSLRIPKRQITIFTGVSGSGKSSIVFDTIATEAQRQFTRTSACSSAASCRSIRRRTRTRSRT